MNGNEDLGGKMQNLNINSQTSPNHVIDRERNISATGGGGFTVISQASQPQHHPNSNLVTLQSQQQSPQLGPNSLSLPQNMSPQSYGQNNLSNKNNVADRLQQNQSSYGPSGVNNSINQQNQHILTKQNMQKNTNREQPGTMVYHQMGSNMGGPNAVSMTGQTASGQPNAVIKQIPGGNQNRVSKQNLREAAGSGGNLKDYGMSIITGGPKQNAQGQLNMQPANKTPLKIATKAQGYAGIDIHEQFAGRGADSQNSQFNANDINNLKDMIEVKTTNNYKIGKQTINQRIGEDFEPDKPIITHQQQQSHDQQMKNQNQMEHSPNPVSRRKDSQSSKIGSQSTKTPSQVITGQNNQQDPNVIGEITDERLEEIKMQHYNRKIKGMGNSPSQSVKMNNQLMNQSHQNEKHVKNLQMQSQQQKRNSQNGQFDEQSFRTTGGTQAQQQLHTTPSQQSSNYQYRSPEKHIVLDNYQAALQQNQYQMDQINQTRDSRDNKFNAQKRAGDRKNNSKGQSQISQYQQQFMNQQNYEISGPINQFGGAAATGGNDLQMSNQKFTGADSQKSQGAANNDFDTSTVLSGSTSGQQNSSQRQKDGVHQNHLMNRGKQQILRRQQIVINTNHCRGELDTVQYVIGKNGYRETNQPGDGSLLWYGMALRDHDLDIIKMRKCIFNRYPLMDHFAKKNIFCVIISRLQRFFPIDYKFMPDSFLLPDEVRDFEHHLRQYPGQTFIAKPSKGRGGDGIILLKKFTDLPKSAFHHEYLVQRYVDNPLILDKKKFDCRLYVLIRGVDPVEAYLCDEGLARFCTHNYKKPDAHNIKDHYMHLTNFSLNKNSQRFKAPGEQFQNDDKSSKQLFTTIIKNLMSKGKDVRYLMKQIKDVAQKTIIALEPYLKNAYHCFISTNHTSPRSFQILGLDILVDETLNAWLLEVNANPSLNVYTDKELPNGDIEQTLSELDKFVKTALISDTIKVVTTPNDQLKNIQELGCLKKILPVQNGQLDELYLYTYAEKMFEILAGQKSYDFITSSQFQRLSKYPGLTNNHILKAHYDIIYKNVVRRSDNNQMDLNCFFEALEELANRLYNHQDPYDNLQEVIEVIKKHVSTST